MQPTWEVLRWEMTYVAGRASHGLYTVDPDGQATIVDVPGVYGPNRQVTKTFQGLRETLYRPGAGTWFTATATLTAQGAFDLDLDLDYDDEPQRAITPPTPAYYAADFARYPRDIEHTLLWLATYLAQAAEEAHQD